MVTEPIATIWVCADCSIARENGDMMNTPQSRLEELWSLIPSADVTLDSGTDELTGEDEGFRDFDTSPCAACGTPLAGWRYRYAVWAW